MTTINNDCTLHSVFMLIEALIVDFVCDVYVITACIIYLYSLTVVFAGILSTCSV